MHPNPTQAAEFVAKATMRLIHTALKPYTTKVETLDVEAALNPFASPMPMSKNDVPNIYDVREPEQPYLDIRQAATLEDLVAEVSAREGCS